MSSPEPNPTTASEEKTTDGDEKTTGEKLLAAPASSTSPGGAGEQRTPFEAFLFADSIEHSVVAQSLLGRSLSLQSPIHSPATAPLGGQGACGSLQDDGEALLGGETAGADPELGVMFDLFYRLRDEECFEDWLQLGIPTTVDIDAEEGDDAEKMAEGLQLCVVQEGGAELEDKKDEEASPLLPVAGVMDKRRRSSTTATIAESPSACSLVVPPPPSDTVDINEEVVATIDAVVRPAVSRQPPIDEGKLNELRMQWILDARTSTETGYLGENQRAKDTSLLLSPSSTQDKKYAVARHQPRPPHLDLRALRIKPIGKDFSFERFMDETIARLELVLGKLNEVCAPQSFSEYCSDSAKILKALLEGRSDPELRRRGKSLFSTAQELSSLTFAAETLLSFITDFINAQVAKSKKDFHDREAVLVKCFHLQRDCSTFVSTALSLHSRIADVEAFETMSREVEEEINGFVAPLEARVAYIGDSVPFPERREYISDAKEKSFLEAHITKATMVLNRLGQLPPFPVEPHQQWSEHLLDCTWGRLQRIAKAYDSFALGHLDRDVLNGETVRVTADCSGLLVTSTIPMREKVREMRVDQQKSFSEIAEVVKKREDLSIITGLQSCMTARHLLGQGDEQFDTDWGFSL